MTRLAISGVNSEYKRRALRHSARFTVLGGEKDMPSSFTWLDHSDTERRRVLDAIDRFKESDTRDELGIATIRDAFSDRFFPGTGVLMTRARYFLFVPWIYQELERRGVTDGIDGKVRRAEVQLIETLGDIEGVIGRYAKGTLKRMPSNIYWLGLESWGIRGFGGTQTDLHHLLEHGRAGQPTMRDDEGESLESHRRVWHAAVPAPPKGFPKEASLDLRRTEAEYLQERIRLKAPDSMLAAVLRLGELSTVPYPWMHPRLGDFAPELRSALLHSQCFAETMQGAALLYNLLLAEADKRESTVEAFRTELRKWSEELQTRERELSAWRLGEFWALVGGMANVKPLTKTFIDHWLEMKVWGNMAKATDNKMARDLVARRELQLKGGRARLANPRALELWGGASGTERLQYRWFTAKRILGDVFDGLSIDRAKGAKRAPEQAATDA